jgi:hypothetical protein
MRRRIAIGLAPTLIVLVYRYSIARWLWLHPQFWGPIEVVCLAVTASMFAGSVYTLRRDRRLHLRRHRLDNRLCLQCGYDAAHGISRRCSECGAALDAPGTKNCDMPEKDRN